MNSLVGTGFPESLHKLEELMEVGDFLNPMTFLKDRHEVSEHSGENVVVGTFIQVVMLNSGARFFKKLDTVSPSQNGACVKTIDENLPGFQPYDEMARHANSIEGEIHPLSNEQIQQ